MQANVHRRRSRANAPRRTRKCPAELHRHASLKSHCVMSAFIQPEVLRFKPKRHTSLLIFEKGERYTDHAGIGFLFTRFQGSAEPNDMRDNCLLTEAVDSHGPRSHEPNSYNGRSHH